MSDFQALDDAINAYLPPRYQHCYQSVSTKSMGSAKLKRGPDGQVAWGEIWTSFCDLALAGGPPHRGRLLEETDPGECNRDPASYRIIVRELIRAIRLTTGLIAAESSFGWIDVDCRSEDTARWLQFAVVAENVSARRNGSKLLLPARSDFQVEAEIKNVTVALAKSFHYWDGHLSETQRGAFRKHVTLEPMTAQKIASDPERYRSHVRAMEGGIDECVDWPVITDRYRGWIGMTCPDESTTVGLLRAIATECIVVRREETILWLPIGNHENDTVRTLQALRRSVDYAVSVR